MSKVRKSRLGIGDISPSKDAEDNNRTIARRVNAATKKARKNVRAKTRQTARAKVRRGTPLERGKGYEYSVADLRANAGQP